MSAKSGIEWTNATWNCVVGCEQVSPGCGLCYAKTEHDKRHAAFLNGKQVAEQYRVPFESVQLKPERLLLPLRWRDPKKIFVCSIADPFHSAVPDEYIDKMFVVMAFAHRHTFQLLTKRADRMRDYTNRWRNLSDPEMIARWDAARMWLRYELGRIQRRPNQYLKSMEYIGIMMADTWRRPLPNVIGMVSVEDQKRADERIPALLESYFAKRGLSCEPLLARVELRKVAWARAPYGHVDVLSRGAWSDGQPDLRRSFVNHSDMAGIDWVIAGGESSKLKKQRPRATHPDAMRSLRDQCVAAGVPFHFKQWGDWLPFAADYPGLDLSKPGHPAVRVDGKVYRGAQLKDSQLHPDIFWVRVGKKKAGRMLDGRTWDQFPEVAA